MVRRTGLCKHIQEIGWQEHQGISTCAIDNAALLGEQRKLIFSLMLNTRTSECRGTYHAGVENNSMMHNIKSHACSL